MNDIAEAASISRPALYLVFESKEEIFKSVYEHWVKETLIEIESKIGHLTIPEEKLRAAFELWTVRPFEMMRASSEVAELLECTFDSLKILSIKAIEPLRRFFCQSLITLQISER